MKPKVVRVPGDKSISHRALILSALASGESRVGGILESADVKSTASVLRLLGARIPELSPEMRIAGKGLRGLTESATALDAGNSGTTVRLMSGVVAAHPFRSRFEGDASLSRRPMKRIAEPLTAMGAEFEFVHGDHLPMTIIGGQLAGISWNTRAASAQTKSAILLAGLVAGVRVAVRESSKSRDHTERLLASLGVPVTTDETSVSLAPAESISPLDSSFLLTRRLRRISSLAFLGTTRSSSRVCINRNAVGISRIHEAMGADLYCTDKVAVAGDLDRNIRARPTALPPYSLAADIPSMIDELPLLACVAAAAGVEVTVTGARELRVKESDRIAAVVANLRAIGADSDELHDGFIVRGARTKLAGRVTTHGDHRIAMSFGVLAELAGNDISIDDPDCVAVSYPRFWADLADLRP